MQGAGPLTLGRCTPRAPGPVTLPRAKPWVSPRPLLPDQLVNTSRLFADGHGVGPWCRAMVPGHGAGPWCIFLPDPDQGAIEVPTHGRIGTRATTAHPRHIPTANSQPGGSKKCVHIYILTAHTNFDLVVSL